MSNARKLADNLPTDGQLGNRNLIINGAMAIAQRGTSATSGPDGTGEGYLTVDRWKNPLRTSAVATQSQSTDTPTGQGFIHSFKLDCTTADTSVASNDFWIFQQRMEKQNVLHLAYGTSSAKSVTVSFWVKSTKTGTYICEIQDAVNDRYNRGAYTVNTANTWEKKTITFVGDTGGGLGTSSLNGASLDLNFWLMAGSDFSGGSAVSGWTATGTGRANGQVNFFDSTSNNWYITGIQLEVGSQSTPFEHESYDTTLEKCQRYFQKSGDGRTYGIVFNQHTATNAYSCMRWWKPMRAAPTIYSMSTSNYNMYNTGYSRSFSQIGISQLSENSGEFYLVTSSLTAGQATHLNTNGDLTMWKADAEL